MKYDTFRSTLIGATSSTSVANLVPPVGDAEDATLSDYWGKPYWLVQFGDSSEKPVLRIWSKSPIYEQVETEENGTIDILDIEHDGLSWIGIADAVWDMSTGEQKIRDGISCIPDTPEFVEDYESIMAQHELTSSTGVDHYAPTPDELFSSKYLRELVLAFIRDNPDAFAKSFDKYANELTEGYNRYDGRNVFLAPLVRYGPDDWPKTAMQLTLDANAKNRQTYEPFRSTVGIETPDDE